MSQAESIAERLPRLSREASAAPALDEWPDRLTDPPGVSVELALFAMTTPACESAGRVSNSVPSSDETLGGEHAHVDTRGLGDPALPGIDRPDSTLATRLAAALDAKAAGYKPRTHHLRDDGSPLYTNRLILETSPYLLQHAHNPVDWYPVGRRGVRARERARTSRSSSAIGYSTCHWCHVMERESFEDEEIARFSTSTSSRSRSTARSAPTSTTST